MEGSCSLGNSGGEERIQVVSEGEDSSSGFSWSQRNYTCSFCKRQFNSAQALGGHMNVHRRDRARLRQLPSWVFQKCPNPNHNIANSSSSAAASSAKFLPCYCINHSPSNCYKETTRAMVDECCPYQSKDDDHVANKSIGEMLNKGFGRKCEMEHMKKGELISLELEIGFKEPKDVLDLELRLGYV